MDGTSWTCYTHSDSGTQGGGNSFCPVGSTRADCTNCNEGPSHAASGSEFVIAAPANYVEFAFWGRTDIFEVELASCTGAATAGSACVDLDGSGQVDVTDLLLLLAAFNTNSDGDTNGDGATNVTDLLALLAAFGSSVTCDTGSSGASNSVVFSSSSSWHSTGTINNIEMAVPVGGVSCQQYWVAGGCGGHDAGRCGITEDGRLYAYYLDAIAWCEDADPFCGGTMGPPVSEGCSMASRAGYSQTCCFEDTSNNPATVSCPEIVDWGTDLTTNCANHHTNLYRAGAAYGKHTTQAICH